MPRPSRYRRSPPVSLFAFQDIIAAVTGVMLLATMLLMLELVTRTFAASAPPQEQTIDPDAAVFVELTTRRDELLKQIAESVTKSSPAIVTQTQLDVLETELNRLRKKTGELNQRSAEAQDTIEKLGAQQQAEAEATETRTQELAETKEKLDIALSRTQVTLLDGDRPSKQAWFLLCEAQRITVATVSTERELNPRPDLPRDVAGVLEWAQELNQDENVFVLLVRSDGVAQFETLQRALRAKNFEVGWDLTTPELAVGFAPPLKGAAP